MEKTVRMKHVKQTKNTFVYEAFDESSKDIVPTLYVNKSAFGDTAPTRIVVTIKVLEGQE